MALMLWLDGMMMMMMTGCCRTLAATAVVLSIEGNTGCCQPTE
jgi:hypothetical protein